MGIRFSVSDRFMACRAIYLLDMKGKVVMNRNYRGDIENNVYIHQSQQCLHSGNYE